MPARDTLAGLSSDLRALPARDRREILSSLSAFERAKVAVLLQQGGSKAEAAKRVEPDFSSFSPWLAARLQEARGETGAANGGKVTVATRQLLVQIGQERAAQKSEEAAAVSTQRSLLGVVAGMLLPWSLLS